MPVKCTASLKIASCLFRLLSLTISIGFPTELLRITSNKGKNVYWVLSNSVTHTATLVIIEMSHLKFSLTMFMVFIWMCAKL